MSERRVLFACDLDSQVFGALPLALAFAARDWKVTFAIESCRTLPSAVLDRLTGSFGVLERPIGALPTDDESFRHDAIGVYVTGSRLALFRHMIELSSRVKGLPRPALFCGFNGLVFEKFEEGLAWRLGYDVIGLNGPRDRDAFVDFLHGTEFARQPSVIVGLRRKTDAPQRSLKIPAPTPLEGEALGAVSTDGQPPADEDGALAPGDAAPASEAAVEAPATAEFAPEEDDDGGVEDAEQMEDADADGGDDGAEEEPTVEEAPPTSSETGPAAGRLPEPDERSVKDGSDLAAPEASASPVPRKLFVFAEQVVVPRSLRERQSLVATLARLAKASPGWDIALKARVRPNEQTFHVQPNHIEKLVKSLRSKPRNLRVTYEPLDALLDRADLFATISSTALFDAFDYGVPSLVASDFGLRNADGAHVFFASGLLVRLCDLKSLDDAPIQPPDERWIRRMGYGSPYSPGALIDWLEMFDPSRAMPRPFVPFTAAATVASNSVALATEVARAWNRLDAAQFDETATPEDIRAANAAGLLRLGSAITAALAPAAVARKPASAATTSGADARPTAKKIVEGPVASFSRTLGLYWAYKRARQGVGLPIYPPKS